MSDEQGNGFRALRPPSVSGTSEDLAHSADSTHNHLYARPATETLVKLNVGGRKFETTGATLSSRGDNFLTSLVASQLPTLRDDDGRFFIDRSGALFEVLLEYLRTSTLQIPASVSPEVRIPLARFSDARLIRTTALYHLNVKY